FPCTRQRRVGRSRVMRIDLTRNDTAPLERPKEASDTRRRQREPSREIDPAQSRARRFGKMMKRRKIAQAQAMRSAELRIDTRLPQRNSPTDSQKLLEGAHGRHDGARYVSSQVPITRVIYQAS